MKKPLYSSPDLFSLSPLMALLPVKGMVGELEKLTASLYARYEKVCALKKGVGAEAGDEAYRRIASEEAMLKNVLDWLSVNTDGV